MPEYFEIKQHDTQPSIEGSLTADGEAVVLDGTEEISFVMRPARTRCADAGEPVVDAPGVIVDASLGKVRYNWADGDTVKSGRFEGEFKISAAGKVLTYPSTGYIPIIINPDVS